MAFNVIGKTIMRNLFSKPATAMYPVVKNEFYPATRGEIVYDESTCNYCTLCAKRCPSQAITVDRAEKIWQIDRKRCLSCNFCISVCNKNSLSSAREYSLPIVKEHDAWLFQAEQMAAESEELAKAGVSEEASASEAVNGSEAQESTDAKESAEAMNPTEAEESAGARASEEPDNETNPTHSLDDGISAAGLPQGDDAETALPKDGIPKPDLPKDGAAGENRTINEESGADTSIIEEPVTDKRKDK